MGTPLFIQRGNNGHTGGKLGKGGPEFVFIKQVDTYIDGIPKSGFQGEVPILYTLDYLGARVASARQRQCG